MPGKVQAQHEIKITYQDPYPALSPQNAISFRDSEAFENAWEALLTAQRRAVKGTRYGACSCVLSAKAITGYAQTVGYAINWPLNSSIPTLGGVVVFKIGPYGHVAVIDAINADSFHIKESNYRYCQFTQRWIAFTDPTIKGYWVPPL